GKAHALEPFRLERKLEQEAIPGNRPAVVPKGRRKQDRARNAIRIKRREPQREHRADRKPADKNRVAFLFKLDHRAFGAGEPIRPARREQIVFGAAMSGKLTAGNGPSARGKSTRNGFQFERRAPETMDEKNARASPRRTSAK